jgi:hypothetical protein
MNGISMNRIRMNRVRNAGVALVAAALLAACGASGKTASPATTTTRPAVETNAAVISVSTKIICGEAAEDIADALGTKTTQPLVPRWKHHIYSCRYVYPSGSMLLSVKQLGNANATGAYFRALAARLGRRSDLSGLGQGAFTTRDHSVVVRKDFKVLVVDPHELPAMFGTPPDTRANVAISVAATVMGCWTGA